MSLTESQRAGDGGVLLSFNRTSGAEKVAVRRGVAGRQDWKCGAIEA